MEKQLCTVGYWLGLICTVTAFSPSLALCIIVRRSTWVLHWQLHYVHLFFSRRRAVFLLAIASWCRTAKS